MLALVSSSATCRRRLGVAWGVSVSGSRVASAAAQDLKDVKVEREDDLKDVKVERLDEDDTVEKHGTTEKNSVGLYGCKGILV